MSSKPKMPKQKCCISTSRCKRCPIRMLRDGTLPTGYTVKKRKLIRTEGTPGRSAKQGSKKGKRENRRLIAA